MICQEVWLWSLPLINYTTGTGSLADFWDEIEWTTLTVINYFSTENIRRWKTAKIGLLEQVAVIFTINTIPCQNQKKWIGGKNSHQRILSSSLQNTCWITARRWNTFTLNFLPWEFLLVKKLKIKKTKTTNYTTFKTDLIKVVLVSNWMQFSCSNSALTPNDSQNES